MGMTRVRANLRVKLRRKGFGDPNNNNLFLGFPVFEPETLPEMSLARKTLKCWMEQKPTIKGTAKLYGSGSRSKYLAPWLRIVLRADFDTYTHAPKENYIDNFELRYQSEPCKSIHSLKVSFLLPQNHGLDLKSYSGTLVVDLMTGSTVYVLGAMEDVCQQQPFQSLPISPRSPINKVLPEDHYMQVLLKLHLQEFFFPQKVLRVLKCLYFSAKRLCYSLN